MRPKLRQPYIRYISVAICLLAVLSNSDVVVLCIGEDGHIAIEAVNNKCCGHSAVGVSERVSIAFEKGGLSANKDDCGSCVDIPLSAGLAKPLSTAERINPTLSVLSATCILPLNSSDFSTLRLVLETFVPTPYFAPLRSIILLT